MKKNKKTNIPSKIVLVIATHQTMQEVMRLPLTAWGYGVIPITIEEISQRWNTPNAFVLWVIRSVRKKKFSIDGVVGTTDDSSLIAAIIGAQLKLNTPSITGVLNCQQKYWSRQIQKEVVPGSTPRFAVVDSSSVPFGLPLFVKPIKSRLSYFSYQVNTTEDFSRVVTLWRRSRTVNQKANQTFIQLFNSLNATLRRNTTFQNKLLAEAYINEQDQITVDGYVCKGRVYLFGMTRSDFISGTISFDAFHFPYGRRNSPLYLKITRIVERLIAGVGLDQTLFNIELQCNPNTMDVWIIEINSRMSQQFMHLIESVTGYHPFHAALDIAVGKRPIVRRTGKKRRVRCSSCFILRRNNDALVRRVPTSEEIRLIGERFPTTKINIFVKTRERLSHHVGDAFTHRYGEVKVSGDSVRQTRSIYRRIRRHLDPLFEWGE